MYLQPRGENEIKAVKRMNCEVIDMHTHIYPSALARRAMRVTDRENEDSGKLPVLENLLARMSEEHVAVSVVQPVVTKPATQVDVNRFAAEVRRPNIVSFGGVHPDCGNVAEELEKLKDMRMAGVKFHPPYQRVHLEDEKYADMWRQINRLRFPVLIHCGQARVEHTWDLFPSGVSRILKYLPDVPVILAHMGGRSKDPAEEKLLYTFPENVFVDSAMSAEHQDIRDFERIAGNMRPERVIFGSDFPYGTQKAAIAYIANSSFSDSEKAAMLGGNAKKILGESIRTR